MTRLLRQEYHIYGFSRYTLLRMVMEESLEPLADMLMAKSDGISQRFYSLSVLKYELYGMITMIYWKKHKRELLK